MSNSRSIQLENCCYVKQQINAIGKLLLCQTADQCNWKTVVMSKTADHAIGKLLLCQTPDQYNWKTVVMSNSRSI